MEKFNFQKKEEKSKFSPEELVDFKKEDIGIFTCDQYKLSDKKINRIEESGGLPFEISEYLQFIELHFDPRPGVEFNSKTVPESLSLISKKFNEEYDKNTIVFIASWIADKFSRNGFVVSEISKSLQLEFAASKGLEMDGKQEQEFIERNIGTDDPKIKKELDEMIYRFDKYEEAFLKKKPTINDIKIAWTRLSDIENISETI